MPFHKGDTHNPHTKLTDCQCAKIIVRARKGERNKTLKGEYGVSKGLVSSIVNGRLRPHLQDDPEGFIEEHCVE